MTSAEILAAATDKLRASEHYLEMRETMLGMPLAPYEKLLLNLIDPLCVLFDVEAETIRQSGESWAVEDISLVVELASAAMDWEVR